jgi:predicted site-specific integrase-resolvase
MEHHNQDAFTLLDSAEARAALRISKSTLQRLVREGKLKRSAVSVGRALFPLTEIQRLISTPLEMQRSA